MNFEGSLGWTDNGSQTSFSKNWENWFRVYCCKYMVLIIDGSWNIKHWLMMTECVYYISPLYQETLKILTSCHTVFKYSIYLKGRLPNNVYINMFWIFVTYYIFEEKYHFFI